VTSIAFFFIPMDPKYIWLMIAMVILTSIGIGFYSPLLWSMYADVADYATEKNEPAVQRMIWMLFSLFPAAIALQIVVLMRFYPIKK